MKKQKWKVFIILALIAVFLIIFKKTGMAKDSEDIRIPLEEISDKARWYEYDSDGVKIDYFAVKASDKTIKTAFDACDVCYKSDKGYSQKGDVMVCNNCGNRYPITGLGSENKQGGGCWPGYLPNRIESEYLVIESSDIEKGRYRFE